MQGYLMQSVQRSGWTEQEQQFSLRLTSMSSESCIISIEAMFVGAKKFKQCASIRLGHRSKRRMVVPNDVRIDYLGPRFLKIYPFPISLTTVYQIETVFTTLRQIIDSSLCQEGSFQKVSRSQILSKYLCNRYHFMGYTQEVNKLKVDFFLWVKSLLGQTAEQHVSTL